MEDEHCIDRRKQRPALGGVPSCRGEEYDRGGGQVKIRLQKALSAAGVASRRRAEEMIARGEVLVNGRPAELGQTVDPERDVISVAGRPLQPRGERLYIALNKPAGVVTTTRATHGEPAVTELVQLDARLFPVGRLDRETVGLLLLTDDGDWSNLVTHPRYGIEKEYQVVVGGSPAARVIGTLEMGVELPDGSVTAPCTIRPLARAPGNTTLSVTVVEGKKRQIRLMFGAVGHPVLELCRVRIGDIVLGDLRPGCWRYLRSSEVKEIRERAEQGAYRRRPRIPGAGGDRRTGRSG
jgi:23S rRNA pseudouridine2605 synthase